MSFIRITFPHYPSIYISGYPKHKPGILPYNIYVFT